MSARLRVLMLMLTDAACMFGVWAFDVWAYQAIGVGRYRWGWEYFLRLWPALLIFIAINVVFRLYQGNAFYPSAPVSPVEELRRLVASAILTHLGLVAYLALSQQTMKETSRVVTVCSGGLTALLAQPARNFIRSVLWRIHLCRVPVAVTGPAALFSRVTRACAKDVYAGFHVVFAAADGDTRAFISQARAAGAETVVSCQDERVFRAAYAEYAREFPHVVYLPAQAAFPIACARPLVCDGIGGLEMTSQRCMRLLRVEKWLLDKVLACLAFVCLSPFFVIIPVLIKLTSRGPVFYRQDRLGLESRPIRIWKFRSMYADAEARLQRLLSTDPTKRVEWEANYKLKDDPRVTPLGRFLRKTSIDEFPQLFNVFTGEMALVGPRPIVMGEVPRYGSAYATFASVKPGITGLWQASGRSDTDYERRVALDVYYVLNWSPWMDVWILLRTVGAVFFMKGAR